MALYLASLYPSFRKVPESLTPTLAPKQAEGSWFGLLGWWWSGLENKAVDMEEEVPPQDLDAERTVVQHKPSAFLALPAELRNEIYRLVFSTPTLDNDKAVQPFTMKALNFPFKNRKAHPLSLLLTCRQIHTEASLLAFRTHTFSLRTITPYHILSASTSHLSTAHLHAITSLSCTLDTQTILNQHHISEFVTHTLIRFPNITTLHIPMLNPYGAETWYYHGGPNEHVFGQDFKADAVSRYVPYWFSSGLRQILVGRGYAWQKGEKWSIEWPALESCHRVVEDRGAQGMVPMPKMEREEGMRMAGVCMCPCGCGEVALLRAVLVQEGGRKVEVRARYCGVKEKEVVVQDRLETRLVEGVERLPVVEKGGGSGFVWEVDEGYWERLRDKNRWFFMRGVRKLGGLWGGNRG